MEQEYLPQIDKLVKREMQDLRRVIFFDWRASKKRSMDYKVI